MWAMPARNNGGSHLACRFKVIKTDGDIEARRLAVHQLHHRIPATSIIFKVRGVGTFGEDQAVDIPDSMDSRRSCSISGL